jgi:membrane protease YdiL (CAAX protease family)
MKRIVVFARSVIPQHPTQLFLLAGSVLLLISMQLRCFPETSAFSNQSVYDLPDAYRSWYFFAIAARLPIFFAGAAGLFICFWPGTRGARRLFTLVLLPSLAGIAGICGRFLYISQLPDFPRESVMKPGPHNEAWAFSTVWGLGPAVHMSVLGFVLVLIFFSRLTTGVSRLPVSLRHIVELPSSDEKTWKRILVFVLISIAFITAIASAAAFSVLAIYRSFKGFGFRSLPPANFVAVVIAMSCLFGIAAWAVGGDRWKQFRQFIRFPQTKFGLLGIIFPTAIEQVPNFAAYVSDRIHWASFEFARLSPPIFSSYFELPSPNDLWMLPGVVFEEIIWRGYLQPRFIQRFGLMRGICLLGASWGASHFMGDFTKVGTDTAVFTQFVFRLTSCIVMSYALAWLTLRSGSVWPAVLSHGVSNAWIYSLRYSFAGIAGGSLRNAIVTACWAILGFVLFRYWPPSIAAEDPDPVAEIAPA